MSLINKIKLHTKKRQTLTPKKFDKTNRPKIR